MKPYSQVTSRVAPLPRADVDTDQIIPARFLRRVVRTGYGEFLFYDWRGEDPGPTNPHAVVNDPRYRAAAILATGPNFGCGSSREHAAWALLDHGFRTIIAASFADIFRNNCHQNGIVPVTLPPPIVQHILEHAAGDDAYRLTVDLETCTVSDTQGLSQPFPIQPFARTCLLEGLDPIALTLRHEREILAYETTHGIAE